MKLNIYCRFRPRESSLNGIVVCMFVQEQATVTSQLASLRYTDLLSYSRSMQDPFARELAAGYYESLVGVGNENSVQRTLEKRNEKRRQRGLLPYRNMLPAFLPNSIAI